jgi:alanine dehydrogenase
MPTQQNDNIGVNTDLNNDEKYRNDTQTDSLEDPKHIKYKKMYKPNDVYYGLGIENETYLLSDKTVKKSGEWIINNRKRERYSVDYWANFKKEDVDIFFKSIDKKKIYDVPVFINSHTFTRCDKNNQHKTMYTKLTEPNPKFESETLHEFMIRTNDYYREKYDKEFLFDGDTFEFTTLDFYKTTVNNAVDQLIGYKKKFLTEINKAFDKNKILNEHYDKHISFPVNYGLINFVSNPRNISICNNSTYHINITLPTKLNSRCEIENPAKFRDDHANAIRAIQWIEPLLVALYGSPDIFSVSNDRFAKGSLRLALSRYTGVGTYDTEKMTKGKLLNNFEYDPLLNGVVTTSPDIKIPERYIYPKYKTHDHWYKQYHENSGYHKQNVIGYDFNYQKHYSHGIELRIFDYFPEKYLKDVINILLLLCQKSCQKHIINHYDDDSHEDQLMECVGFGSDARLVDQYVENLSNIFDIPFKDIKKANNSKNLLQIIVNHLYTEHKNSEFLTQISPNMRLPIITDVNKKMRRLNTNFVFKGTYHPKLTLGIIGESFKQNEKRLPLHPKDFCNIPERYRSHIFIDQGYGKNFGYTDDQLRPYVGGILKKEEMYKKCDVMMILKYTKSDYKMFDSKKICWGWHHLVQNKENVDIILKKQLTSISIEQMFEDGRYILDDNRLIAGYASIMHAMQLKGLTGYLLVDQPKIAVISYGCVGKGAVDALISLGFKHVDVYTKRIPSHIADKRDSVNYLQYPCDDLWYSVLAGYDIVVNCILQDPLNPKMFLTKSQVDKLEKKMFIIDISCDIGMGFDFATHTTFDDSIIRITDNVDFYAVDHSPTIYYDTITSKISKKLIPYIYKVIDCNFECPVIKNAIQIYKGIITDDKINKFQKRT